MRGKSVIKWRGKGGRGWEFKSKMRMNERRGRGSGVKSEGLSGGGEGGIKGILDERRVFMGEMKGILTDKEGGGGSGA